MGQNVAFKNATNLFLTKCKIPSSYLFRFDNNSLGSREASLVDSHTSYFLEVAGQHLLG